MPRADWQKVNERDGQHAYEVDHEQDRGRSADQIPEPSAGIFGNASGGSPVDGKYDLTITSTPPCALPVSQNCSQRKFDPTADQWEAYSAGTFLTQYLDENNIDTLSDLMSKASTDFLPTTDAQRLTCNPDARVYECSYPSFLLCDASSKNSTAGFLVVAAVVRMSQLLRMIYSTIDGAKGDVAAYITQIVVKFFQPQAEQKWELIVTAVSSVVGLFTFIAILIDGFTGWTATPALVAAVVGIQSAIAAAANFASGFLAQKPDDTYLAINGNYTQSAIDYARGLEETVDNVWNNKELGRNGIVSALASGAWLDVPNPYNVTGLAEQTTDWLENLIVTSYINRVFDDADAFITFLPYGKYSQFGTQVTMDFTQEECEQRWKGHEGWSYFSTCDVPLGTGGAPGMAVVTRPSTEGKGSKEWTSEVDWEWAKSYKWDPHDMVASAVIGYGDHGFGYNLTSIKFDNILNKGSQEAIDTWKTLPLSTPGMFNLPVCVIRATSDIPGADHVPIPVSQSSISFPWVSILDPC